jgi:hypothetical protein
LRRIRSASSVFALKVDPQPVHRVLERHALDLVQHSDDRSDISALVRVAG